MKLEYKDYPLTYNGCLLEYNNINGEEPDYSKSYLTFEALENGTISFNIWKSMGTDMITSISYSKDDGKTWITTNNVDDKSEHLLINVDVEEGDKILWKGNATLTGFYDENYYDDAVGSFFSSNCLYNAYGNIMSLLYEDNFYNKIDLNNITYIFSNLFGDYDEEMPNLIRSAKNLILPATILTEFCYHSMFVKCANLAIAPELPATTLVEGCYSQMFYNCSSLNNITMLAEDVSASECLAYWVNGVAATGTFTKSANIVTLPTGNSGIPSGWTVENV